MKSNVSSGLISWPFACGAPVAARGDVATWQVSRANDRLEIVGELRLADASAIWEALRAHAASPGRQLDLDLAKVVTIDGAAMAMLVDLRARLLAQSIRCELVGGDSHVRDLVALFRGDRPPTAQLRTVRANWIVRLGAALQRTLHDASSFVAFTGELAIAFVQLLRRPADANLRSVPSLIGRAGADALLIVLLLDFLVGFVMAFQSAQQLQAYGANIYVADIIGISVTRELAPLMTAIIVSGRSGAGFAAELGAMRVSEEIDALRTLGFGAMSYLVVPRIITLAIVVPVLTLVGDCVGVAGGMFVGRTSLGITPAGFVEELRAVLVLSDVWTGLLKSLVFGIAIAAIACHQGLTTRGAASGVGQGTTATVVRCLFTIVVVDTLGTIVFRGVVA